jgi:isoleucyl-tRNA synthetase
VDNLADWLLVSRLSITDTSQPDRPSPEEVLAESREAGLTIRILRAPGEKCDRCWHYETDVAEHRLSEGVGGRICGRCRQVLEPLQAGG